MIGGWRLRRGCMQGGDEVLRLLLMDTCGQDGTLALADTALAEPIGRSVTMAGRTTSERLLPELRGMLEACGWELRGLHAVGVVSGPGSFTGVRVGLAAAKGLCEAAGLPLVTVSRLRVLAAKAGTEMAALDAGRGELFFGRFAAGEEPMEVLLGREAMEAAVGAGGRLGVCEERVRMELGGSIRAVAVEGLVAADSLKLVVARTERREFDDARTSDARYGRRTDLEMLLRLGRR